MSVYTYQQIIYAKRLYKLRQAYIVKDNIHLTYKYKNRNKAFHNIDTMQDRINKAIIEDKVNGNGTHPKNLEKHGKEVIHTTVNNERKRIHHDKHNKSVNHATKNNSEIFTDIFNYRRQKIAESLEDKIENELKRPKYQELSDSEKIRKLRNDYGDYGKKRLQNIIKDAMHTNESNIAFINAIENGYNYKIWMNGRSKGRTRPWHKAKHIASVPIDETFDIYGSYPARMMYPGDLNGGAENVANCKCWLNYTNRVPKTLRKKTTYYTKDTSRITQIKNNVLSKITKNSVDNLIKNFYSYEDEFKKSVTKTRDKLKKLYPIPKNLTAEETRFMKTWGKDSGPLNRFLRGIKMIVPWESEYWDEYIKQLNIGINRYDNIKFDTILHRNTTNDFFIEDVGKEGIFETPISTTFNKNANKEYGEFHITVLAPKGTNGAYLEELMKNVTSNNHLDEWLLPLGTKYKTLYKNYKMKEAVIIILI